MDLTALVVPAGLGSAAALALFAASFAASFITIAFGIGGGVFLLAVMASLMPPAALIPVHGATQFGSNAGRAALMIRHVSWRDLGGFCVGSVAGVALGGAVVVNIPPAFVQIGVGLFTIWSVLMKPPAWLRRWALATGAISSFLTMFFGATGTFVATYTKSLGLDRHRHVATHAALMTAQHLLKTLTFGLLGFAFAPWAAFTAVMIAAGLLGTWTGRAVLNRLTDARFRRALDALLLLISARLIWAGVAAL